MPGDINQAIHDAGAWVNNKIKDVEYATGMLKPDLASLVTGQRKGYVPYSQGNAYLGSEDIGNRMQQAGLVSSERRPMTELAASFVSPSAVAKTAINAPKTAMNMLRMADNLETPSRGVRNAQGMYIPRGQMGAIENLWHGSPYEFDKFSADAREVGFRGDAFGKGAYAAEDVDVAKYFTEHGGGGTGDKGYLYNLRLAYPGEKEAKTPLGAEHFIDWDKPFEQQSQFVRDKITNLDEYDWLQTVNNALENNEGRYLYDAARSDFGSKKEASDALAKAGIPGMRYKEPGKDSYNYVVFDDKLIDIVSRNNQPISKAALTSSPIRAYKGMQGDEVYFDPKTEMTWASLDKNIAQDYSKGSGRKLNEVVISASKPFDFRNPSDISWLTNEIKKPGNLEKFNEQTKKIMGDDYSYEMSVNELIGHLQDGRYQAYEIPMIYKKIKDKGYDAIYMVEEGQNPNFPNIAVFDKDKISVLNDKKK